MEAEKPSAAERTRCGGGAAFAEGEVLHAPHGGELVVVAVGVDVQDAADGVGLGGGRQQFEDLGCRPSGVRLSSARPCWTRGPMASTPAARRGVVEAGAAFELAEDLGGEGLG